MNISDYINIGLFIALVLPKSTRYAAVIILAAYVVYFYLIEPLSGDYYYHAAALLNLVVGWALFPRYKLVALLSFVLILINSIGKNLYDLEYPPTIYDDLSLASIVIQIILLYIRALTNGFHIGGSRRRALDFLEDRIQCIGGTWRRAMVFLTTLNSFQYCVRLLPKEEEGKK